MLPLLFAWLAFRPSRRPADTARAYGYHRSPVLAAFTNDISLVFICIWIFGEAADRLYPLNRGWLLLVLRSAWFLVKDAAHVLLEGVPAELDVRDIGCDLVSHIPIVEDVHHIHAWSLSQGHSLLTLHAHVTERTNPDSAVAAGITSKATISKIPTILMATAMIAATSSPKMSRALRRCRR